MGRIIASGNIKGGTGKSTLAVNAACGLAARGWRTVVIDIDPQGSATAWSRLGRAPIEVAAEPLLDLRGPGRWHARGMELARSHDVVILDLPPLVTSVIASACLLADLVLVPLTPSAIDVPPTEQTLRLVRTARASQRGGRPKALLVPNKVDRRGGYDEATRKAVMGLGERWGPTLHFSLHYVNAFAAGSWVGGHAPGSQAAAEVEALVLRLEKALGLKPPPDDGPAEAPSGDDVASAQA
jgi:chromosome partitioning protein